MHLRVQLVRILDVPVLEQRQPETGIRRCHLSTLSRAHTLRQSRSGKSRIESAAEGIVVSAIADYLHRWGETINILVSDVEKIAIMVRDDWVLGGDRRAAAADRIYAAATELVIRDGLDALDIDTVATKVHCSRATIYRHAGGKAHIRDAVLTRLAAGIVDKVRRAVDGLTGADRVIAAITVALQQIRSDPLRRLMFSAGNPLDVKDLHSSPVLAHLAAELTGITDDDPHAAQWIVRVVVSLAYSPIANSSDERAVLERFVAPAFDATASTETTKQTMA